MPSYNIAFTGRVTIAAPTIEDAYRQFDSSEYWRLADAESIKRANVIHVYECTNPDCEDAKPSKYTWDIEDYAERGAPVCPTCGDDLTRIS